MADDVINQLLWSRRLPRVSFNLIACLEPVKQDDHYFYAEILVCKFHLGSRKACLRMRRRFCHQIFLCQNVSKEILFTGAKFHAKPSRGSGVIQKKPPGRGGGCKPPPLPPPQKKKKIREALIYHIFDLRFERHKEGLNEILMNKQFFKMTIN